MNLQTANPTPIAPMTPPARIGGATPPPSGVNTPLPIAQPPGISPPTTGSTDAPAPRPTVNGPANPALRPPTSVADAKGGQVPLALSPATSPIPAPTGGAAAAGVPLASGTAAPYANATTNTPGSNTDYTNKTITPGAGVDRLALAKSNFENFRTSTEPEYQAELRDASQQAAGAGQIGSGMARGRLGDIGTARATQLQANQTQNLNNATEGSIGDSYNNIGIAQQQQGFQNSQQQQAFQQQLEQQQLEEMLRNGQFGRSATTLGLGDQGNPSDIALQLAGIYGNQASGAGQAAGSLLGNNNVSKYLNPAPVAPPNIGGTPYDVNDPNQNIYAGTL